MTDMQYRPLGRTGLQVSTLGLGASSLGAVFHPVSPDDCIATVNEALDGGINFIDVSPAYGGTLAELNLGRALQGIPREKYLLATKIGCYSDSRTNIERSLDAQLLGEVREILAPIHNFNWTRGRSKSRDTIFA